jgi:Intrinsic membrane protein PufX
MSDKPYFHETDKIIHLRVWALGQMVWGAFLAGLFLLAIAVFALIIYVVSQLLPEDSKTSPDPNTWSSLVVVEDRAEA